MGRFRSRVGARARLRIEGGRYVLQLLLWSLEILEPRHVDIRIICVCPEYACTAGTSFAYTHVVRRSFLPFFICAVGFAIVANEARCEGLADSKSKFYYQKPNGDTGSAPIVRRYYTVRKIPVIHPDARVDSRLDPRLCRAATIAQERANARSRARCWRYVKEALLAAGVIDSYPKSNYAWQAGEELERTYGFRRLPISDQFAAPLGSVLVFGHGSESHVVIRTKTGFASDYWTKNRCKYPLVAVYGKF